MGFLSTDLPAPSTGAVLTYLRITLPRAGLSPREQTVAWTIASHYNWREGCARPPYTTVAEEMNLSKDVIWRCVRAVTRAGIWAVKVGCGRGHASEYRFPLAGHLATAERSASPADDSDETPATVADLSLSTTSAGSADLELSTKSAESNVKVREIRDERSADFADPTETGTETLQLTPRTASDEAPRAAPPWVAEGISYAVWIRRERAAGRQSKHNPPR